MDDFSLVHCTKNLVEILKDGKLRPIFDISADISPGYANLKDYYYYRNKKSPSNFVYFSLSETDLTVPITKSDKSNFCSNFCSFGCLLVFDINLLLLNKFGYSKFWTYGKKRKIIDGTKLSSKKLFSYFVKNYSPMGEITFDKNIPLIPYLKKVIVWKNKFTDQLKEIKNLLKNYKDVEYHEFSSKINLLYRVTVSNTPITPKIFYKVTVSKTPITPKTRKNKRCPNGTRKNKKTGECVYIENMS